MLCVLCGSTRIFRLARITAERDRLSLHPVAPAVRPYLGFHCVIFVFFVVQILAFVWIFTSHVRW